MAMASLNEGVDAEYLRRLKEFQVRVRSAPTHRLLETVVPARAPLSGGQAAVMERLRRLSTNLADSLEQALRDMNDSTRLTYVGPAGEVREVMRAAIHVLAPDDAVKEEPWFVGVKQGSHFNPSQAERIRYSVQKRGGNYHEAVVASDLIDERIGRLGRLVYQRASAALHVERAQREVQKLTGYVFAVLDDVIPD